MRILVISDTHGRIKSSVDIARKGNYDLIFHLGDHYRDGIEIAKKTDIVVHAVVGNCDFSNQNEEKTLTINGRKIKLIHGHRHHVKMTDAVLRDLVREENLDMLFYGHTHVAETIFEGEAIILNPGSISLPRDGAPSYAILEIDDDGKFSIEIARLKTSFMI